MKTAALALAALGFTYAAGCSHMGQEALPPAAAPSLAPAAAVAIAPAPAQPVAPPAAVAAAAPEYVTIAMQIDVAKPAKDVWAKVGDFCDITEWFPNLACRITTGDGGIGTVRAFNPEATAVEVVTAWTELSYGYVMPPREGRPFNLYHGFLEAKPLTANTTRLLYTLMYDVSMLADQAAKDADVSRRRTAFEGALAKMKTIAEGK